jgi:hypothetical protein
MRYTIDIDGTICIPGSTNETRYTGATPIQERIDKINQLYDDGHYITYLTARGMGRFQNSRMLAHREFFDFTYNQLRDWGCKFHELHLGKPSGDYYIDDKGVNANEFFSDY